MPVTPLPAGQYRIRKAGAKSEIANLISNAKKCFYVQIGVELFAFDTQELAEEYVAKKDLVADRMSLDYGVKPAAPAEDDVKEDAADDEANSAEDQADADTETA